MVMATYVRPNLSPAAVTLTSDSFDALAKVSEAFVFVYLGMALLAFPIFSHHTLWLLTIVALAACLVGRLHVFPLLLLATRLQPGRQDEDTAAVRAGAGVGTRLQRCDAAASNRGANARRGAPRLRPAHALCIWFSGLRGGVAFALAAASYGARSSTPRCQSWTLEP
jgi:sodium/hydrogen exchanger 8